jgi:Mce-associated membrane protein
MAVDADTTDGQLATPPDDDMDADEADDASDADDTAEAGIQPGGAGVQPGGAGVQPGGAGVGRRRPGVRSAVVVGLAVVMALAGLVGWLGYRVHDSRRAQDQRQLFLQVGRQGALNLTTIDYTRADADVARILDSSTGTFRDDFQKRSAAFIGVVKQARSTSAGTVTEAGLEADHADQARVLVAVAVKTTTGDAPQQQQPRAWRMRIDVQKVGDGAKVSNVEFVP